MARAFHRSGRGAHRRYVATMDPDEREIVATLMEQVADLLEPPPGHGTGDDPFDAIVAGMSLGQTPSDTTATDAEPRDPALDRLLPPATRDDDESAAEFRRLTEGGLRHRKANGLVASVEVLRESGNEVALDEDQARSFLTALTDVRLVLGERLDLRADEDLDALEARADALGPENPLVHTLALYDFLTWLQETLATAVLR